MNSLTNANQYTKKVFCIAKMIKEIYLQNLADLKTDCEYELRDRFHFMFDKIEEMAIKYEAFFTADHYFNFRYGVINIIKKRDLENPDRPYLKIDVELFNKDLDEIKEYITEVLSDKDNFRLRFVKPFPNNTIEQRKINVKQHLKELKNKLKQF